MKALTIVIVSLLLLNSCNNRDPKPLKAESIVEIRMGNMVWMQGNLNVDYFQNGDLIPEISDDAEWQKTKSAAWCYVNNDTTGQGEMGRLYNYYAVTDPRGLLPAGWHVATADDWDSLRSYLVGQEDISVRLSSDSLDFADTVSNEKIYLGYKYPQSNSRKPEGIFIRDRGYLHFWLNPRSTGRGNHIKVRLGISAIDFNRKTEPLNSGFAVRCVKD